MEQTILAIDALISLYSFITHPSYFNLSFSAIHSTKYTRWVGP